MVMAGFQNFLQIMKYFGHFQEKQKYLLEDPWLYFVDKNVIMRKMKQTQPTFLKALRSASKMLYTIAPMLLAVIGLVGLFQTFITPKMLQALFKGSTLYDTLVGTVAGGISVGQPFLSYIIGGELLKEGISLYAVTAFILSFVSLGLIQLPLEYSLFGIRFTMIRNLLSFLFAILISWATVITVEMIR